MDIQQVHICICRLLHSVLDFSATQRTKLLFDVCAICWQISSKNVSHCVFESELITTHIYD